MSARVKYVSVNIPVPLMRRIKKLLKTQDGFISSTDYVTYILRVILSLRPEEDDYELFSSEDLEEITARLIVLGSVSKKSEYAIKDLRDNLKREPTAVSPPVMTRAKKLILLSNQRTREARKIRYSEE